MNSSFINSQLFLATQSLRKRLIGGLFGLLAVSALFAQPANEPLLTRSTPVEPNLLFILDTSGSMGNSFVYSQAFRAATDACGDDEIRDSSPFVNLLYYDPRKRYRIGRDDSGALRSNASIDSDSKIEVYLPIGWNNGFTGAGSFNPNNSTLRSQLCDRARYIRYEVTSTNRFFLGGQTNVTATEVFTNPFGTKSLLRTDCAGTICTATEERQNIANWRQFHSTRQLAARTGAGEAFANVPTTFRLGYGTIFATSTSNYSTMTAFPTARNSFYTWINGLGTGGNTPLRSALDTAGRYYSQQANTGPWGSKPWDPPSSETAASHVSCRRSFSIL
ncbi:MAG: hypothetical protein HC853_17090, partial [Anaerolineae bacterium]|nr:hypothetical protein [Anaerolineae bacterium]